MTLSEADRSSEKTSSEKISSEKDVSGADASTDFPTPDPAPPDDAEYRREDWHWLQRLMDNPWILLVLGILIPMLSYTGWGWIELLLIKPAQLP